MGLQTTMTTSLTGMTAAETTIDVVGNNVANANTVGFKQSSVSFATQFLQTQSIGSSPTASRGGTNPRQVGLGVKVAEISPDFTQGTVEISSNPLDLAIQGEGFFIVQGPQGEQFYTRNGQFKTNANNEIVTITGHRVLGYSVDANFEIQPTGLKPLSIPLGAAAVAQATQNVSMEGNLNPNDTVGANPEIIQSSILSDGSRSYPTATPTTATPVTIPNTDTTGLALGTTASPVVPAGTYRYKFAFVDGNGNIGPISAEKGPITVPSGGVDSIDLTNLPTTSDAAFVNLNIYRDSGSGYQLVKTIAEGTTSTSDDAASGTTAIDESKLTSASYSYYITFYDSASGRESRPSAQFGPFTSDEFNANRIRLDGFPTPNPAEYDRIRIYRNTTSSPTSFYRVGTVLPTGSFIDSASDSSIAVAANLINLEGPAIAASTRLMDLVSRDDATYNTLFATPGTLTFHGTKNGRDLAERTLTVGPTTTVQNLLTFMEESMGVVKGADEPTFPSTPTGYGGHLNNGRLEITSNMGMQNALSIDLGAFRFTPSTGPNAGVQQVVPLKFNTAKEATDGEGSTAELIVYDSLGSQVRVQITTVLEKVDATGAQFRWIATSPDHHPTGSNTTVVGTGVLTTDGKGKFVSATESRVNIDRGNSPAVSPLSFNLDFSKVTGLEDKTEWAAGVQDGLAAGTLTSFIITESGRISGVFSNGSSRNLGQIRMARFANNGGLEQIGDNMFQAGVNSGLPIQGDPGSQGIGAITAGATELSNTDIGQNLIELILASTQYRGGARVITAVQQLLDELLALRR
jgi:flagellar hook protein FlgE